VNRNKDQTPYPKKLIVTMVVVVFIDERKILLPNITNPHRIIFSTSKQHHIHITPDSCGLLTAWR